MGWAYCQYYGYHKQKTGKSVWQVGLYFTTTKALRDLWQIIGQHHVHMIPKVLPGEGNILVFDNGGWAGYGAPNLGSPTGVNNALRDYSRVVEFDPVILNIVWQYPPARNRPGAAAPVNMGNAYALYSSVVGSAQRLPNGNTLIDEGAFGRVLEFTLDHEVVWEYISPYGERNMSMAYRAYRVPYEWVPQIEKPREKALSPIDNRQFRVPVQ